MIHTPEPWEVTDLRYIRQSNEPRHVVARASKMDGMEANARRIVACVNACAGISTELLECPGGNVAKVAGRLMKQRDELLAALERLLEGTMSMPNRGRSTEGKWTTINALTSSVDSAKAAIAAAKARE